MKYLPYFFLSTFIFTFPVIGMKRRYGEISSQTQKDNLELRLYHNFDIPVPVTIDVIKKDTHKVVESHSYNMHSSTPSIQLNNNPEYINKVFLTLPTSPQTVCFPIEKYKPDYKSLSLEEAENKINIKDVLKNKILASLLKKNTYVHVGAKVLGYQEEKSFFVYNRNVPCVSVKSIAYRPIVEDPIFGSIEETKFVASEKFNILCEANQKILCPYTNEDNNVNDAEVIIKIFGALQKIKIQPNSPTMENTTQLLIEYSPETHHIVLTDNNERTLAEIATPQVIFDLNENVFTD